MKLYFMGEMSFEYDSLSGACKRGGVSNENSTKHEVGLHSLAKKLKSPN